MRKKQVQLITAVACSLAAFSASAAEPCKAYVKLDLGYGFSTNKRFSGANFIVQQNASIQGFDVAPDKNGRGMIGYAGVGYAFNDALRAEVLFDFKPKMKAYGKSFLVETRELGGAVRVAYDFNNNTPVIPFIFGQLGASNVKPKVKPYVSGLNSGVGAIDGITGDYLSNPPVLSQSLNMKAKTVMTYQGGFGLSVKGSDIMNVDLTYGIGGKSSFDAITNTAVMNSTTGAETPTAEKIKNLRFKKQMDQSLTLGFRFTM